MPLHTSTVPISRRPRKSRVAAAAVVAACLAGGAATVVIADDRPASQARTTAEPSSRAGDRYFDLEANKADSMRALGRHLAEQR